MKKKLSLVFSIIIGVMILFNIFLMILFFANVGQKLGFYNFFVNTATGWVINLGILFIGIIGKTTLAIITKRENKRLMKYYEEHPEEVPRNYTSLEDDVSYRAAHPELFPEDEEK